MLRGFTILADKREKTMATRFLLSGMTKFQVSASESEVGTVLRFHKVLDKAIPESIQSHEREISALESELSSSKEAFGLPFPRAAELTEKKERLDKLTKALDIDAQEQPAAEQGREEEIRPGNLDSIIQDARTRQVTQMRSGEPSYSGPEHTHI